MCTKRVMPGKVEEEHLDLLGWNSGPGSVSLLG